MQISYTEMYQEKRVINLTHLRDSGLQYDCRASILATDDGNVSAEFAGSAPKVAQAIAGAHFVLIKTDAVVLDLQQELTRREFATNIDTRCLRMPIDVMQNFFEHRDDIAPQFERRCRCPFRD